LHIGFLVHDIHFGGGGERVSVNLANWLIEKNHLVTIVSTGVPRKDKVLFNIHKNVDIDYLGIDFRNGLNAVNKIKSVFAVRDYFRRKDLTGLVIGIGTYPNLLLSLLPRNKNIRRIGCQHCSYASLNLPWRFLGKIFFGKLDTLVSLTEWDLPKWQTMNRSTVVIPNAVSFFPAEGAMLSNKIILAIGRIDHGKAYDLLLQVFERFSTKEKEWKLRIIGDGPLKNKIRDRVEKRGLTGRVEILSPTENIEKEYLDASVYMMTSRSEGLPMVLLEAKACGLPVISFDCETGPADIIRDGKDGYLIDCFDTNKMAEKLAILCADPLMRRKFGCKGREDIRRFFPEIIGEKWLAVING
jgi:glycosyltransferase involved in cell wall biosynthesis